MEIFTEFVVEIFFRRLLVGLFGYYTLLYGNKLIGNKKGVEWLTSKSVNEGDDFGKGCFVGLVGLISLTISFVLLAYIYNLIITF